MQASYTNSNGQVASLGAAGPQMASLNGQAMALGYDDKSLSAPPPHEPLAFWTRAYGAWASFDGDNNAASANRNLGGFVSGIDARVTGSWRIGLAAGYSQSNLDVDKRYSSADVNSFHLGGYGGGMAGPLALRGGGTWTWNNIDTSRAVTFPGFYEREKASYNPGTGQLFGEVAYPTAMWGLGGWLTSPSTATTSMSAVAILPRSPATAPTRTSATPRLACVLPRPCIGKACW